MTRLFPSAYDDSDTTWASVRESYPFDTILLHDRARAFTSDVKTWWPRVFIIHRVWCDSYMTEWLTHEPYAHGVVLADRMWGEDNQADAYISLNEPPCGSVVESDHVATFDAGFADRMSVLGKVAVIGNFGSGYPEPDILNEYLKILYARRTHHGGMILGFHAYGPNLLLDHDSKDDLLATARADNAGRYQDRWPKGLLSLGLLSTAFPMPLVITELGPSGYGPGISPPGWRGHHTEEQVWSDLSAFMRLNTRAELLGASPYCFGNSGAAGQDGTWENFNYNGSDIPLAMSRYNGTMSYVSWSDRINMFYREQARGLPIDVRSEPVNDATVSGVVPSYTDEPAYAAYLESQFADAKYEWEAAGGLLDNFLIWLVRVGKVGMDDPGFKTFILDHAKRRLDSATIDWNALSHGS